MNVKSQKTIACNGKLHKQVTMLNYGRLLLTAFMKKSEATENDAIIAFSPNAKRYLSKMFYPIAVTAVFACMMFFTSNTTKANDTITNLQTEYSQEVINQPIFAQAWKPGNTLQTPWWQHYTVSTVLNPLTCCLEITVTHHWGGLHNVVVHIKRDGETINSGIVYADGEHNQLKAIICAEQGEDIVWSVEVDVEEINNGHSLWWIQSSGTITAEDIEKCEFERLPKDCWDKFECRDSSWKDTTVTIHLDDFPNCPITYRYKVRQCEDDFQIKGAVISFWTMDCNDLLIYLRGGAEIIGSFLPDRITSVFNKAYRKAAENHFLAFFHKFDGNPALQQSIFDCNNPIELRKGVEVTYFRGSCISYCASYWLDEEGKYQWEVKEDECSSGTSCCKLIQSFCYEYDTEGNPIGPKADEKREQDNSLFQCDPNALPEKQSCRTEGVIFNFRTLCSPTCDIDE